LPHRILLVDDEPNVLHGLKRMLVDEPYELFTANSADEGFAALRSREISLVVSDERMPGMSGSEFLSVVREEFPDTMRIILTGQASLEAAIRAINSGGIHRFLVKPCKQEELVCALKQILEFRTVLVKAHELLKINREQAAELERLERSRPGFTAVNRNRSSFLLVDESAYTASLDDMLALLLEDSD
jgi:DNA-binding NtrC family response regulator